MAQSEHSVGALAETLGLSIARVSHHLAILRSERLVIDRRQGKRIIYSLPGLFDVPSPSNRALGWTQGQFEIASLQKGFFSELAPSESGENITVFAASSFFYAFQDAGQAFQRSTGIQVRLHFGSSGALAREVEAGAKLDLFASASPGVIDQLDRKKAVRSESIRSFAKGSLTIWRRCEHKARIENLEDLLSPEVRWVVIANPAQAPSGALAVELLKRHGLYEALRPKLLLSNDAAQAQQFADTENEGIAITSFAVTSSSQGLNTILPEFRQSPIEHSMALMRTAPSPEQANSFVDFLSRGAGRAILKQYGFLVC
ncbi:MAG TPA: molybdate ABC transporter substrate-binding protein [Cyanobacteria bacterium UBA8530]|nr:molybdate ABC transporter substrate-binding protein [Cyanobacteria bacterium UBA8530]